MRRRRSVLRRRSHRIRNRRGALCPPSARPLPPNAEIVEHDGKPHVRLRERGRTVLYPLTKDGRKYLRPSARWYFELRTPDGRRRVKGFTDLRATEQKASEMERRAERGEVGMIDPHARRPLADHLTDYAAHLEAKGGSTEHVKHTAGRLAALFAGCGFGVAAELDAGKVAARLNALRRGGEPAALPAGVAAFTPAQAAGALGVSTTALSAAVRRLGLPPATGNGKARRYPRATVEAVAENRAKGCGPETVNHYVRAARGFSRWLVQAGRLSADPFRALSLVNTKADVRHGRRELTADELRRLFATARASSFAFRGLSGEDRAALYSLAAGSGFRVNALANLTPAAFDFAAGTVILPAQLNKSRKVKVQPLPMDVVAVLAEYAAGRPAGEPLWGGSWPERATDMIRFDLEAAGIPYAVPGPDGPMALTLSEVAVGHCPRAVPFGAIPPVVVAGTSRRWPKAMATNGQSKCHWPNGPRFADFHALRHSYLTALGRAGVDLRTAQELAGHSSPVLTARYSHRNLADLTAAVAKLAGFAVGTDLTGGIPGHSPAPSGTHTVTDDSGMSVAESLEMKAGGACERRPASAGTSGASGIRTQNQGIMSPLLGSSSAQKSQAIPPVVDPRCTPGYTNPADQLSDLARLVQNWPTLPDHIKAAVMALVNTAVPTAPVEPKTLNDELPPGYERKAKTG